MVRITLDESGDFIELVTSDPAVTRSLQKSGFKPISRFNGRWVFEINLARLARERMNDPYLRTLSLPPKKGPGRPSIRRPIT